MSRKAKSETRKPPRRGRPKGSGLDDTQVLRRIAHVLQTNAGMSPTTAIKQAGINNPSVIRRLRDKLKSDVKPRTQKTKHVSAAAKVATSGAKRSKLPPVPVTSPRRKAPARRAARPARQTAATRQPAAVATPAVEALAVALPTALVTPPNPATEPPAAAPLPPQTKQEHPNATKSFDPLRSTLETAAAMARLQRHIFEQSVATSPLGLMLRSHAMFAEFMATAMASHLSMLNGRKLGEKK